MALYAIGDLHLSFSVNKPMDIFGGGWVNYIEKTAEGFKVLRDDDLCVLCGDTSWAMTLPESLEDFRYIDSLPGKKIILKGNHDYWWTTVSKMKSFFEENGIKSIDILHNNCFIYENAVICGTRGWMSDDSLSAKNNDKIAAREVMRLRASLDAAKKAAANRDDLQQPVWMCFFHYPPRYLNTVTKDIVAVMEEYGVSRCFYGHLHGHGHRSAAVGIIDGIEYDIISADYLDFKPKRLI